MFLHFDIKEDVIAVGEEDNLICPQCNKSGCITFCVLVDYVQFLFVPLLSLFNKSGFAYCENCDKKYWRENMPMNFKDIFEDFLKKTRYPAWHFKLLWIVLGIFTISFVGNLLNNSEGTPQ